jgi:hypothetical protein
VYSLTQKLQNKKAEKEELTEIIKQMKIKIKEIKYQTSKIMLQQKEFVQFSEKYDTVKQVRR